MLKDVLRGRCPLCGGSLDQRGRDAACTACDLVWSHRDVGGGTVSIRLSILEEREHGRSADEPSGTVVPFPGPRARGHRRPGVG